MADINLTQVIHNVKEAYVDLTGDTGTITYGNIDTKISEIQTGGGNIGYEVKFKVDGNDYYVTQCVQGDTITEPPTPTSPSGNFTAWQLNGVDITFPYTPSADVELAAHFATVRTEMEIYAAGTNLFMKTGNPYATKTNDGTAICGYSKVGGTWYFVLVADNLNASLIKLFGSNQPTGTITYDGSTYYYCYKSWDGISDINSAFAQVSTTLTNWADIATATLDHYFYND